MSGRQRDDDALNQRVRERASQLATRRKEELTVAQQLMVAALDQTIEIDLSGVTVTIYAPFAEEVDRFLGAARRGDTETLCAQLADLCVDPSLDADFFRAGALTQRDLKRITEAICGMDEETRSAIDRFRRQRDR